MVPLDWTGFPYKLGSVDPSTVRSTFSLVSSAASSSLLEVSEDGSVVSLLELLVVVLVELVDEELEELLLALLLEVSLVVVEPPLGAVLELLSLLAEVLTLGSVSTSLTETDVPSFVDASIERLVVEDGVYELTLAS